ncbi:MAG: hypothetical protein V3R43_01195 [bacterium]
MRRRRHKTPGEEAQELWEGLTPDNMNTSIRQVEHLLGGLDPASPEWEEAFEVLEAMSRYREDVRGD